MKCPRCHIDFCWCCMGEYGNHSVFYALCPGLPFNLCVNISLVIMGMIFMPLIFTLGPLGYAFYAAGQAFLVLVQCFTRRRNCCNKKNCATITFGVIFALIIALGIALPICLGLAGIASAILLSFGIVAGLYYGLVYIGRITYYLIAK